MTRARRLIMVACVATALSADRLAEAAPVLRPQVLESARKLADRFVITLRRSVPVAAHRVYQRDERPVSQELRRAPDARPIIHTHESSPFQFRLPPPTV